MENENGGTAESFKNKIDEMFDNCKQFGLNTVFVQVRPFCDSFYPSQLFPWSKNLTGESGKSVEYDPLEIMLESAKKYGLSVHAWINPFRISPDKNENHPITETIESDLICVLDNGIYLNPANISAQKLILDGVREIIENYDIDGIHIDDYFYPSTDENIDKKEYNAYKKSGGKLDLSQWRIENINSFVSGLYTTVKSANKDISVSISPAGNINNNYKTLFADVKLWGQQEGYCDILIPQIYFGFDNEKLTFEKALNEWAESNTLNAIKLVAGIGAYKSADPQNNEWKNPDIVKNQVEFVLNSPKYDGYCLFSYSSLMSIKDRLEQIPDTVDEQ